MVINVDFIRLYGGEKQKTMFRIRTSFHNILPLDSSPPAHV